MKRLKTDRVVVMFVLGFLIFAPIFILLLAFRFRAQDLLNIKNITKTNPFISNPVNPLDELKKNLEQASKNNQNISKPTSNGSYSGPYLHFKLNIEGRNHDQSTRLFLGIAQGDQVVSSPVYVLSFLVDVPVNGEYSGISLSGIDIGTSYVAYLKGATQLTKATVFTSQPTLNDLGTIDLLTGDLNEDNLINTTDADLLKKEFGKTPLSADWKKDDDFNTDQIINSLDLVYITRNLNKAGDSGAWVSSPLKYATTPQTLGLATQSGTLSEPPTASESGQGYWLWIPKY